MKQDSAIVNGHTFLVTDTDGRGTRHYDGFYHYDTQYLDTYTIETSSHRLEPLEVTSPRPSERIIHAGSRIEDGKRALHLTRHQVVDDCLCEQLRVTNLTGESLSETVTLSVGTAFNDIFEVRDYSPDRTRTVTADATGDQVTFVYDPDDLSETWETTVTVDGGTLTTTEVAGERADATFEATLTLDAHETTVLTVATQPDDAAGTPEELFTDTLDAVRTREQTWYDDMADITHDGWEDVLEEGRRNLLELRLDTDEGAVYSAGVPWFVTAFGRDSLIAAYQAIPLTTAPAEGTCRYLAAHQATTVDDYREAEPGKIFHEIRHGEAALRGDVPHSPYYGTIDATALFVVLVHETWRWTGDDQFVEDLWENVTLAIDWLQRYGDVDDDGFVEYQTGTVDGGLTHEAWKDSSDGIMHPDGTHPTGPIAVAEAQGYHYDALVRAAELARDVVGDSAYGDELETRANSLQTAFDDAFWVDDLGFYAVALDGENAPVETKTTNPGHCLWSGLIPESRADDVIDRFLEPDLFSGWGIRTVAKSHNVYNPQSYHLGSVWPHDTSLVVLGMAQYGRMDAVEQIAAGIVDAAKARGNDRLPELFAGFDRDETGVPVSYGTACEPQAWSAATPFALLRALGAVEPPN